MEQEVKTLSGITGEGGQKVDVDGDFTSNDLPEGLIRLDIACGDNKTPGYTGIDRANIPGVDIVHDLEVFPWPVQDNSVYEATVSHYAEHVKDLKGFMEEVYRILMPGGVVRIIGPYWANVRCWQDFTHVRALTEMTFHYFNQKWMTDNKLTHYGVNANFEIMNIRHHINPEWSARASEAQIYALRHYINVCNDIEFWLKKLPIGELK